MCHQILSQHMKERTRQTSFQSAFHRALVLRFLANQSFVKFPCAAVRPVRIMTRNFSGLQPYTSCETPSVHTSNFFLDLIVDHQLQFGTACLVPTCNSDRQERMRHRNYSCASTLHNSPLVASILGKSQSPMRSPPGWNGTPRVLFRHPGRATTFPLIHGHSSQCHPTPFQAHLLPHLFKLPSLPGYLCAKTLL